MPISVGLSGDTRNIVDIYFGGQTARMAIAEAYVGDASGTPRLVWTRVKPIVAFLRITGSGFVGSAVTLTAYDVTGGKGRYIYEFRVNGSIVRTVADVPETTMSTNYTPQFAGYHAVTVTVTDYNDPTNTYTASGGFTAVAPMIVSVTASPDSVLLGNNIEITWSIQNGQPPYRCEMVVYRNGGSVYIDDNVASPFSFSTESGYGVYSAQVFVTDAYGQQISGYSNGVTVYTFGYTSTSNVNVRAGAGTSYDAVGVLSSAGTQVEVYSGENGSDGYVWYYIRYGSIAGYVRSDLLVVP